MVTEVFVKLLIYWSYTVDLGKTYYNILHMYSTFVSKLTIRNFKISRLQCNQLMYFKECTTEFPVTRFIITSCVLQWNLITVNYISFISLAERPDTFVQLTENSWHLVYNCIINCFILKNACLCHGMIDILAELCRTLEIIFIT